MFRIVLTAQEATDIETAEEKLLGLPARGAPATPGIHGPIASTWNGVGNPPAGWRVLRGSSFKHPTLAQWATPMHSECTPALANGRKARLSVTEQAKMATDLAGAIALPVDWVVTGAQAAKGDEGGRT